MSRRWPACLCIAALFALFLFDVGSAGAQGGPNIAPTTAALAARPTAAARDLRATADFRFSAARTAIAFAALVVFASGLLPRTTRSRRLRRLRVALLLALALASYASYYQFFRLVHPDGFASPDNFHYYVGSKYFPELGYFGLYECGITALAERGVRVPGGPRPRVRDLRSMKLQPASFARKQGADCRERFAPERWQAFTRDVGFFVEKWPPHIRNAVWADHGYHPSPVWTWIGGAVADVAPTDSAGAIRVLLRTDRVLVAVTLVVVTWAFGLEVGCLAAILWGTGHLWRYTWVGDAFLRHLWWIATFLGLCALRRGATAAGGVGLATAASLRIFPGAFGVAWLAGWARSTLQGRSSPRQLVRFAAGAGVAVIALFSLALLSIGQGVAPIPEFTAKISEFASVSSTNKMGLGVVAHRLFTDMPAAAGALRVAAVLGLAALFWRGLRDALPWEATALGFTMIPFVTDPTNYYYSFFVMGAVLAARRPLIGAILLAISVAWGVNGLVLYRSYAEYPAASVIAVLGAIAVTWAMGRSPVDRKETIDTTHTAGSAVGST